MRDTYNNKNLWKTLRLHFHLSLFFFLLIGHDKRAHIKNKPNNKNAANRTQKERWASAQVGIEYIFFSLIFFLWFFFFLLKKNKMQMKQHTEEKKNQTNKMIYLHKKKCCRMFRWNLSFVLALLLITAKKKYLLHKFRF